MNQACALCGGACCEFMTLAVPETPYIAQWLRERGHQDSNGINFNCHCKHLIDGRCSIYPIRPEACKQFEVGSSGCYRAIARQRTPQQQLEIIAELGKLSLVPANKLRLGL